jgi:hypothetical protein
MSRWTNTALSASSRTQYEKKLTQWVEYTNTPLDELVATPDASVQKLYASPHLCQTPTNRHLYLSAMVAYLTHVTKGNAVRWKEIQMENNEPLREHYARKEPTEKQRNKQMEWEQIHRIRVALPVGTPERLLLTLYTCMEPLRADYYATEIIPEGGDSKEENYVEMTIPPRLVVRDFKTKKKYEKIENTLPPDVEEEVRASLVKHPRAYLFVGEDKKSPYPRKLFSNWACRTLTRILAQPMTLTVLRHLYISQKIKEETPLAEMKEMAKKMGHSREMQRGYEWHE